MCNGSAQKACFMFAGAEPEAIHLSSMFLPLKETREVSDGRGSCSGLLQTLKRGCFMHFDKITDAEELAL